MEMDMAKEDNIAMLIYGDDKWTVSISFLAYYH